MLALDDAGVASVEAGWTIRRNPRTHVDNVGAPIRRAHHALNETPKAIVVQSGRDVIQKDEVELPARPLLGDRVAFMSLAVLGSQRSVACA
jgi:hypothetical protein